MGAHGAVNPLATNLVLFDGVCNLCSSAVQFIIQRDPKAKFQFASLQSATGQEQLERFGLDKTKLHSILLIQDEHVLQRSDAALAIAKQLSGAWPAFYFFKIFPRFFRDGAYDWIARNRYKFFGKKEACWIPTPELKERFLE